MLMLRASIPTRSIKTRSRELCHYPDVIADVPGPMSMAKTELFLGVDGGGTRSRARLCDASGHKLAEAQAGPANIRFGLKDAFASVRDVTVDCLEPAHLSSRALPRDLGALAPIVVEHAARDDPAAVELMRGAASHLDAIAARLHALGASRLALLGGLAPSMEQWLAAETRRRLVPPAGDAVDGA